MTDARRIPLIAGNWKMNTTVPEGVELVRALRALPRADGVEVAVLPPFTHLWPLRAELEGSGIALGAQDAFWEDSGAFTGEVSPLALAGWCDYVLVGHSERRRMGETDGQVAAKLRRALTHGLRVIAAVGETLEQREAGDTMSVVHRQVDAAFGGLEPDALAACVVAYEPVWAIGTGRTATPKQAQQVCHAIRRRMAEVLPAGDVDALRIIYGGSVTGDNAADLAAPPDIDGALVGGASLRAAEFGSIVAAAARAAATA